ncbi:MAG: helix-turn-helix domain-containing protein [Eubacteriales bacterium]|nr:helix-turn-helix domain-containing protein [Eubacteriales bacterium]
MDLGQRLRQARLEAGLSQRQLCGGRITRNMLSQIENGTAQPSMATLQFLAAGLGKPVGFFLQEEASPNQALMDALRGAWDRREGAAGWALAKQYRRPDPLFDREEALLEALLGLLYARELLDTGRTPYAVEILEGIQTAGLYCAEDLEHRRLAMLAPLRPVELPSLDDALLLRGELALKAGDFPRAARLLDGVQDREGPRFCLLRGRAWLGTGDFAQAVQWLEKAERAYPAQTAPLLEQCCRELGDYRRAYEYACKQRK